MNLRIQWKDLEALISGHPQDAKKVTGLELAAYGNVKIQSLYPS